MLRDSVSRLLTIICLHGRGKEVHVHLPRGAETPPRTSWSNYSPSERLEVEPAPRGGWTAVHRDTRGHLWTQPSSVGRRRGATFQMPAWRRERGHGGTASSSGRARATVLRHSACFSADGLRSDIPLSHEATGLGPQQPDLAASPSTDVMGPRLGAQKVRLTTSICHRAPSLHFQARLLHGPRKTSPHALLSILTSATAPTLPVPGTRASLSCPLGPSKSHSPSQAPGPSLESTALSLRGRDGPLFVLEHCLCYGFTDGADGLRCRLCTGTLCDSRS